MNCPRSDFGWHSEGIGKAIEVSTAQPPIDVKSPFHAAAEDYYRAGYLPIPLPLRKKYPPPKGVPNEIEYSERALEEWLRDPEPRNIGSIVPDGVVVFDIDGPTGQREVQRLERKYGKLPCTDRTSRAEPTRYHLWYMTPNEITWPGKLGDGLDVIYRHYRYMVMPPSIHPSGVRYQWETPPGYFPYPDEFADLSPGWLELADSGAYVGHDRNPDVNVTEWINEFGDGEPCKFITGTLRRYQREIVDAGDAGGMHDAMVNGTAAVVRDMASGHPGGRQTLGKLRKTWQQTAQGTGRRDAGEVPREWRRALEGAVQKFGTEEVIPDDPCDAGTPERFRIVAAAETESRLVTWLWRDWIPAGVLACTAGHPDVGKSLFHVWLAARVSRGKLPGVHADTPRNVLMAGTEDSWAHVVRPRLEAARADLSRVKWIDGVESGQAETPIDIVKHLPLFERAIREHDAALLSLDPLISFMGDDVWNAQRVREYLEPLVKTAERTGCTVVGNVHFNKSNGDADRRMANSGAFRQVPRVVIEFAAHADGTSVMSQTKNNLGKKPASRAYTRALANVEIQGQKTTQPRFMLQGESVLTVDDIISGRASSVRGLDAEKGMIIQLVQDQPYVLTKNRICTEFGDSRKVRDAFDELVADRVIVRSETPVKNPRGGPITYTWGLPATSSPLSPATGDSL